MANTPLLPYPPVFPPAYPSKFNVSFGSFSEYCCNLNALRLK